jgi:hypothetical protein
MDYMLAHEFEKLSKNKLSNEKSKELIWNNKDIDIDYLYPKIVCCVNRLISKKTLNTEDLRYWHRLLLDIAAYKKDTPYSERFLGIADLIRTQVYFREIKYENKMDNFSK